MSISKIKNIIEKHLSLLVLLFMGIQPILDVFSYFLGEQGDNAISTALRFLLLAVVSACGFLLTHKKKQYLLFYGIAAVFWVLHVLNCLRVGYTSMFSDTSNYLRIISLPMYTLSFITFFNVGKNIRKSLILGFALNFILVVLFTALPWMLGTPKYTYAGLSVGVMGWFGVANAQSAIVALLCPITILFAYRTEKYFVFLLSLVMTMGLLYLTGTKLTYYSILLICAGLVVLFLINLKTKSAIYILPLVLAISLTVLFKSASPMERREQLSNTARGNYSQMINESLKANEDASGEDDLDIPREKTIYEKLAEQRRSRLAVYADKELYGKVYREINDRFGVYNVMDAYDYTVEPTTLSDSRQRKAYYAKMIWSEKDFLTKLVGIEYSDMLHMDSIYDLENDFPAIFYFCGYLGFAMYMVFFGYFGFLILRGIWRYRWKFLSLEIGTVGMTFILAMGAAQISGNVLRKPNVTIYCAVIMAYIYHLMVNKLPDKSAVLKKGKTKKKAGT